MGMAGLTKLIQELPLPLIDQTPLHSNLLLVILLMSNQLQRFQIGAQLKFTLRGLVIIRLLKLAYQIRFS
jgi:hypothetical protein